MTVINPPMMMFELANERELGLSLLTLAATGRRIIRSPDLRACRGGKEGGREGGKGRGRKEEERTGERVCACVE